MFRNFKPLVCWPDIKVTIYDSVKFLVAISPTGTVTFISKCWGGHVSNHFLTANSGLL